MRATIFGAGNIGRGLIGIVLSQAGYDVTYVDASQGLVDSLAEAKAFNVVTPDGSSVTVPVASVVSAFDTEQVVAAVAESDLVATAVGAPILKVVAEPIASGLGKSDRTYVNMLACENAHPNGPLLREHVAEHIAIDDRFGFPEVVVDRIVSSEAGALDVLVEENFEFLVDANDWKGPAPESGIELVDPVDAYIVRKLWLVNGLHAATAYLGLDAGYNYIHEAISDAEIASVVSEIADLMVQTLERKYPSFTPGAFAHMATASQTRFADPEMVDPVHRVARNPIAKLQADERLLGPAIAAHETNGNLAPFAKVFNAAASGVDDDVPGATEFAAELSNGGILGLMSRLGAPQELLDHMESNPGETNMTREVTIKNPSGLHARPAAMLVEAMKGFDATAKVMKGEKSANAASIMSVLALGAVTGDLVTISTDGNDAEAAADYIEELLLSEKDGH